MSAAAFLNPTTTFPMVWQWNAPVAGKVRRGQPCKIVKQPDSDGSQRTLCRTGADRRINEQITVEFTDGAQASTPRRAIRMRKWAVDGTRG